MIEEANDIMARVKEALMKKKYKDTTIELVYGGKNYTTRPITSGKNDTP